MSDNVAPARAALAAMLVAAFERGEGRPGGWVFEQMPTIRLANRAIVPSVAGWRRERVSQRTASAAVPDFICMVISPSAEIGGIVNDEIASFAAAGVAHTWLVAPFAQMLEVLRRAGTGWAQVTTLLGERCLRAEPFEDLELDFGSVWEAR